MRALKSLGVPHPGRLRLGLFSLSYLRRFPIDKLKIDQSFVRDTTSDAGAAGICCAIIGLGHQLRAHRQRRRRGDGRPGRLPAPRRVRPVPGTSLPASRCRWRRPSRCSGGAISTTNAWRRSSRSRARRREPCCWSTTENVLRALVRLLRRDSYQILVATRPREALELLANNPVQVIPVRPAHADQSGTEFLSQVKDMYPTRCG